MAAARAVCAAAGRRAVPLAHGGGGGNPRPQSAAARRRAARRGAPPRPPRATYNRARGGQGQSSDELDEHWEEEVAVSPSTYTTKTYSPRKGESAANARLYEQQMERRRRQKLKTKELQRELTGLHSTEEIVEDLKNWKSPPGGFFAVPPDSSDDEDEEEGTEEKK